MSDPKNTDEAIGALRDFVRAAARLSEAWEKLEDPHVLNEGYPESLPSFDEFVATLQSWRDKVEA